MGAPRTCSDGLRENALRDTHADPQGPCNLYFTHPLRGEFTNLLFDHHVRPRSPQRRPLGPCSIEAGLHPLLNYRTLELCKHAEHSEHRFARRGGCVEGLLVKVEIDLLRLQVTQKANEILQT